MTTGQHVALSSTLAGVAGFLALALGASGETAGTLAVCVFAAYWGIFIWVDGD